MITPPTPQPQPAPLPERIETALAWRDHMSGEDLMYGPTPDWMRPPDYRALLAETAAALAAAQEREAALRAALERIEAEATVFEVCYRGALRDMDGWHGPLAPEDSTSMGIMPAITAALGGQS